MAARPEKVYQLNMLSNIVQSLRVWVRRLWRRRTRSAEKKESFDSRDAADEVLIDQPTPKDDTSAEPAGATDSDQSGQVPTEIEPLTLGSAGSEKTPSDPPEDALPEPDSPSAQPAEDLGNTPNSNADVDGSPQPDLTDPPPEPPKRAEPPEDDARYENSDFLGGQEEETKPKPKAPTQNRRKTEWTRRKSPSPVNDDVKDNPTFTPRPELICRKASWQWEVVLAADDECNIMEVRHNGESLNMVDGEYSLSSLSGSLSIDYKDRESDQLPLFDGAPLIFKMPNDWNGDGRKVGGITSGHFIVMAPREWKRTGSAPVEPEECTDANFTAHFFYVKKGKVAGDVGGFEDCDLTLTTTGFELDGDRVFDDCEDGELFVGAPPSLSPTSDIVWARIGEEREGGWKGENFKPADQSLAEVLNGRQGRFFVRVYDGDAKLLDSGEFRYLRDLREIRVNDEPYSAATLLVPPSTGYSLAEVQFVSADSTDIQLNLDTVEAHVTVQAGGILIVEPHPDGDHISCALKSGVTASIPSSNCRAFGGGWCKMTERPTNGAPCPWR